MLAMIGGAVAVVVAVGLLASRNILKQKPAAFLREQAEE
jgi:ABC-type antimicrobial peptide transport system permease subunit